MASRKIYEDDQRSLEIYVNTGGKLYIRIGNLEDREDYEYIALDINDAKSLLSDLTNCINNME